MAPEQSFDSRQWGVDTTSVEDPKHRSRSRGRTLVWSPALHLRTAGDSNMHSFMQPLRFFVLLIPSGTQAFVSVNKKLPLCIIMYWMNDIWWPFIFMDNHVESLVLHRRQLQTNVDLHVYSNEWRNFLFFFNFLSNLHYIYIDCQLVSNKLWIYLKFVKKIKDFITYNQPCLSHSSNTLILMKSTSSSKLYFIILTSGARQNRSRPS